MKRRVPLSTLKPGQQFTYHGQDYFVGGLVFEEDHDQIACYEVGEELSPADIFDAKADWVDFEDGLPAEARDLKVGDVIVWQSVEMVVRYVNDREVVFESPNRKLIVRGFYELDQEGFVWLVES